VVTQSGASVQDALVTVYHLDENGAIDQKYSPLRSGHTDIFGDFVADLRVTDRMWTAVRGVRWASVETSWPPSNL
jgi:hypothetical protein